jgi:predicted phage terminase large subunit-like protein
VRFSEEGLLLARASPAAFAHVTSGGAYVPYEHVLALDEQLSALALGEIDRLIVSMPPRHGKSELISRYLPAWYLGRFPDRRVMLTSYEAGLAASWGRKARDVLREAGEDVFGVRVSDRVSARSAWEIEGHGGGMVTAGVGGPITGRGAHLLIIDDPVKNNQDANSELMRERAWDWWRSTARSRLQRQGAVVLVMTRWHEDDLAGRLLSHDRSFSDDRSEGWVVLSLPALAEQDDPLGRVRGAPLCPGLGFDCEWALRTRAAVGSYWWNSLYQQSPRPPEGFLFKRRDFRYWRHEQSGEESLYLLERDSGPHLIAASACTIFQSVDVAASERESADYSVISTWAVTPERELLLVDRERERFELLDVGGFVRRSYLKHKPSFVGIESFGYGLGVVQELVREGLPIRRLRPDKDKVSRALVAVARYEEHRVYHPRGAPWLSEWEEELLAFPNAAHDDQVDTAAYAARELANIQTGGWTQRKRGRTIMGDLLSREF